MRIKNFVSSVICREFVGTLIFSLAFLLPTSLYAVEALPRIDALRFVGITNQPAPGFEDGVVFRNRSGGSGFFDPVINNRGQVAFYGRLAGTGIDDENDNGLWIESGGILQNVAQQGQLAFPPDTDAKLQYPGDPRLNNKGDLAFPFSVEAEPDDSRRGYSLWTMNSGQRELIAHHGSPAPGTLPGSTFIRPDGLLNSAVINDSSDVAFWSEIDVPNSPISTHSGIWLWRDQSLSVVAYTTQAVPGSSSLSFRGTSSPSINDAGQLAFSAGLDGPGVNRDNNTAIWIVTNGQYEMVAREGSPVPGLAGISFGSITRAPRINAYGEVVFSSDVNGVSSLYEQALWSTSGGGLHISAQKGKPAPGAPEGAVFGGNSFQFPVINDRGDVAFYGGIARDDSIGIDFSNDTGIWMERDGQLGLVIAEGEQIPDLPAGTEMAKVIDGRIMLNARGQLAFLAELRGPNVTNENRNVLLATDANGDIRTVLRRGDLIEFGQHGLQPITNMKLFMDTGNGDGRSSSFNDLGQLALRFNVANGHSGGILVSNLVFVPEPTGLLLIVAGVAGWVLVPRAFWGNSHR